MDSLGQALLVALATTRYLKRIRSGALRLVDILQESLDALCYHVSITGLCCYM